MSYVPRVSIISKLINTRTSIIQHLYNVTPAGRVKQPSISNVCEWVNNSWQRVKSETIVKSLKKCVISNVLDGSEGDILYEESDASNENNHEDNFSAVTTIFWVSMMNKLHYGC